MQRPEELPSGRWRGVARDRVSGKRFSKTFDTWSDANSWTMEQEADMDGAYTGRGFTVSRQQRGIPRFAEHVLEWAAAGVEDGELGTLRGYQSVARMLARRWPTERVDQVTELMIRGYLSELRDAGVAPSTRTSRLTVLRHAMRAAVKAGYRPDDPTLGVKGPRPREHEPRRLEEQELMLMLACLPGWLWAAALLSHDAGLRISEVCGLKMRNLNLLHGSVSIVHIVDPTGEVRPYPKSKVIRHVPLSPRALAALREHHRDHPPAGKDGPVFAHPDTGAHLKPNRIRDEWDRALQLARLDGEKPTWHDLRHGCGTALADSGADPWVIQAVLGHESIATSQRYTRKANLSRQATAITGAFGPAEAGAADEVPMGPMSRPAVSS
ncbi:MAG: tyrosine-type recombinase/integrase [Pseudonocardiaceae bacterium]